MDYSKLRRSTNVEDNRASGLGAMWNEIRPDTPSWDELKTMVEHPATPLRELKKKQLPSPILPAKPESMEAQAGINALDLHNATSTFPPDALIKAAGGRGTKSDREDRAPQQFASTPSATPTTAPKGGGMRPEIVDAITRAAKEAGEDPAFALAVAERESKGDPNARASKSIYGIYQMRGDLRQQYGAGDSSDPYEQAQGWMRFIGDTRQDMTSRLGRDPTNEELYLAHHFGPDRAARMLTGQIPKSMATSDVFTPYEMELNPHFGRAGTVGNLTSGITSDIAAREARYGGATGHETPDFASFGQPSTSASGPGSQPIDFAQFGSTAPSKVDLNVNSGPSGPPDQTSSPTGNPAGNPAGTPDGSRPGTEVDLSQYGFGL